MSLLIYCYLSGIWVSPRFTIWCVVKVCGEGSFVAPCCMVGTEVTMAIRGRFSGAHVSGWVLQSCLQCFLRPRHATFNCTKTHMAYYSMQAIGVSLLLCLALFLHCLLLFYRSLNITFLLPLFTFPAACHHPSHSAWEFFFFNFCLFFCCVMSH